jgi:hypothetical protein
VSWRRRGEPRGVRSERVGAALAGEPGDNAATIVVEDLAELVAGVGQDARRSDLVGLVEEEVALDRDVMGAEGVGGDRGGELKHVQRTERRLGVQVTGRRHADRPAAGRHGQRSLRAAMTCWTETAACPAAAA